MARRFRIARIYRPSQSPPGDREPVKIALVLSGAVALGTFEAGVVYEILAAIDRGAPLTVDIITGSSAGSLVGAMVAKALVAGVPFEHVLPRWKEYTLQELTSHYETPEQAKARGKQIDKGILSSESVRLILEENLVHDPIERSFQPQFPAPRVVLTVTLTNLDGLPGTGTPDDEHRFAEAVIFRFSPPDPKRLDLSPYPPAIWARIAEICRAGSAFPGAFDPGPVPWLNRIRIPGLLEEVWENEPLLERLHRLDPSVQPKMRYADGGILDEQPVERAVSMLPLVTGGTGESGSETLVYDPRRCLLFIEPDPPATSLDALKAGTQQSWFATFTRAIRLWTLSASPHTSQKRALTINRRQERLFLFLAGLARRMREERQTMSVHQAFQEFRQVQPDAPRRQYQAPDPGALGSTPGLFDPGLYKQAIHEFYRWMVDDVRFSRDRDWLNSLPNGRIRDVHNPVWAALVELREAYIALEGVDPTSPGRFQTVLEEVHGSLAESLGLAQPWVALHEISPEDPKRDLKGEELIHFGGFFSREFLEHDYEVGRYYAHLWLKEAVPDYSTPAEPVEPPPTQDGLDWRLIWQNRGPLWRMTGRIVGVALEAAGLSYEGSGQLLVRLLWWSLLFSLLHAVLLLVGAWLGWIVFPPQYERFRFWVLMGTSIFPLAVGLVLGLVFRQQFSRTLRSKRPEK
ncbi:MAG TPA: patatin-like phospholipase family protein [Symbiobacteriaceae bacterium]|nr:patatin-like phospholipase family protein [Symbiobacteriaceae bacterium]